MTRRTLGIAVVSIVLFAALNGLVLDKEWLRARGSTVYLELAPVDPRSLMQGDYMRLRYDIAEAIEDHVDRTQLRSGRVVVRLDDRRVAHFERIERGSELEENELVLRWRYRERISIGSNAFYFQEGRADRYDEARYAELRVDEAGNALLIGLCDEDLEPLGSALTSSR